MKTFVLDFIEGRITPAEFEAELSNPVLLDWLQSLIPEGETMDVYTPDSDISDEPRPEGLEGAALMEWISARTGSNWSTIPYDVRRRLEIMDGKQGNPRKGTLGYRLNIHSMITQYYRRAFPDETVTPDTSIEERFDLMLDAVPEYVEGTETDPIIDAICNELPEDWSKSKKVKHVKARIKEVFHLEPRKYPRWVSNPDWPVCDGRPMKYVSTKKVHAELWEHRFVDVVTGEERTVEDYT